MALSLGKLTILVGAGVLGSIWVKEGRMPTVVSDVVSGALKIALKPITQTDSAPTSSKPKNDALIAQVNSLRQELQLLASNRPLTIVSSRTGGRRYGVVIVIVVLGYGYVWWKGWKLPDFMFATKRGLKDACDSVSKELDKVFHSVKVTKNHLSSKLEESNSKCDDIVACTTTTKEEVSQVRGKVSKFKGDIQSVACQIKSLETKMGRIQGRQDETKEGVAKLLLCTLDSDRLDGLKQDGSSGASRLPLEPARITASLRTGSVPAALPLEPPSPSTSDGSSEGYQIPGTVKNTPYARIINGNRASEITERPSTPDLSPRQPVRSAGVLSRTISAALNFKFL